MTGTVSRSVAVLLTVIVLVAGCTSSSTSAPPLTTAPPATATPSAPTSEPTAIPTASPTARPTAAPTRAPTAATVTGDTVAVTVVDGLRVRSQPRVSSDSSMLEPLVPLGTKLYVLDGPVSASGYTWYEVVPLTSRALPTGWVASAGRDGESWLAASDFDCPPLPTDFRSLAALPKGVGLACFPRVPITVQARLFECNCDIDYGGSIAPGWFGWAPPWLVDPGQTRPEANLHDNFGLNLDPTGQHPDVLPIGRYLGGTSWSQPAVVEVTGIYDHPAAASCTFTEWGAEPAPTQACRLEFAVTRLVVMS